MRTRRVWSMAASVLLGLAASGNAADEDGATKPPSRSFWGRLFGGPPTLEEAVQASIAQAESKSGPRPEETPDARDRRLLAQTKRAFGEYMRREKVLDALEDIALEKNDAKMMARVKALTNRSWAVYLKKSGQPDAGVARKADAETNDE